jgi:predicted NACHT family NTPase
VRALISGLSLLEEWLAARQEIANKVPGTRLSGRWYRPEIPLNAITEHARLVLLGDPGSGKSTVLRYLVVWLAETLLAGNAAEKPVPLFCPLGRVAQRLSADPESDLETLIDVLLQPIIGAAGLRAELRAPMLAAWRTGSVLLCLDGLDEVSGILEPTRLGLRSRRERIAEAIRQLARQLGRAHCRHLPDEAL